MNKMRLLLAKLVAELDFQGAMREGAWTEINNVLELSSRDHPLFIYLAVSGLGCCL